jgi:hypothetical protein
LLILEPIWGYDLTAHTIYSSKVAKNNDVWVEMLAGRSFFVYLIDLLQEKAMLPSLREEVEGLLENSLWDHLCCQI